MTGSGSAEQGVIQPDDAWCSFAGRDHAPWLRGPDRRHIEPLRSHVSTLRVPGLCGGFWNDLCRPARLDCDSTSGMNPTMAAIMGVFQIVWVCYGLSIASRPAIARNLVAMRSTP